MRKIIFCLLLVISVFMPDFGYGQNSEKTITLESYVGEWKWETENHLAPLILIYADLMGSNNSRCLEAANRLMEYGLNDFE